MDDVSLATGVGKVHVLVADGALAHGKVRRTRLVLDVGTSVQHVAEAAEAGDGLLEGLGEVEDVGDGGGEHADVERVGGQVGGLHLPLGNEPAAHDQDDRVEPAIMAEIAAWYWPMARYMRVLESR